ARQNLFYAAEAKRLDRRLDAAGVPHLFVKGVTLNMLAYGTLGLKRSCDIDLLVDPEDYGEALPVLEDAGYVSTHPPAGASHADMLRYAADTKDTVWHNAAKRVTVELHQRLTPNRALMPAVGARSPRQEVEIAPGLTLATLAREELVAYLFAHGALTAWSRLKWVADLAALLAGEDEAGLERLYRRALVLAPGRSAAQALLLVDRLFGLPLGPRLRKDLGRDPVSRWLAGTALRTMLQGGPRELDEHPLGTARIHLSSLVLQRGWRYTAAEIARKFRAPAEGGGVSFRRAAQVAQWFGRRARRAARG
ncbi:MAG: nucleotidyltransferase family protein, partial [Pseudomonadota bacterium]|nr:nucleotidyltransferase family protein [Pseudomonadota bacterium]